MRIPDITNDSQKVQLARLSYVHFEHKDLKAFSAFAEDFGFVEAKRTEDLIYYRGYGKDPYVYIASQSKDGVPSFKGPAFVAQSADEFEKAARIPGAVLSELQDAPGGGKVVTFERPDGTIFRVVYGQEERKPDPSQVAAATHLSHGPYNTPFDKPRKGLFLLKRDCIRSALTEIGRAHV